MNKKLLAVAIAGAFAAPVAMADTSNVVIYGTIAVSVDQVDGGSCQTGVNCQTAPTNAVDNSESRSRVSSNTSIIGFKGTEDLGNGLSAVWQIEQQIALDSNGTSPSGTSGLFAHGRNNFAGLSSKSMGTLTFGLQDSPLKTSTGALDLYGGGNTIADYRTLFATRDSSVRALNSVLYTSPTINGFTGLLQTAAQQENGSTGSPSFWGASANYANGPIFATLAYEHNKKSITGGTIFDNGGGVTGVAGYDITTSAATDAKFKTWRAGFGYNFGVAKVGIAYQSHKVSVSPISTGTTTFTVPTAAGVVSDYKRNSWHVSGAYNVTAKTQLGLQYTKAGDISTNVAGLSGSDTGANQWTLGVNHGLSKRTNVYALYTQVRNENAARYT